MIRRNSLPASPVPEGQCGWSTRRGTPGLSGVHGLVLAQGVCRFGVPPGRHRGSSSLCQRHPTVAHRGLLPNEQSINAPNILQRRQAYQKRRLR